MAKKRKSENIGLDEVEKTMYTTFCSAANSLSQLYTQAQNQQKLAFQAGERHGMEKLYQLILRAQESGSRLTIADICSYLQLHGALDGCVCMKLVGGTHTRDAEGHFPHIGIQNELDYGGDEVSMSAASQFQNQPHIQQQNQLPLINTQISNGVASQAISGHGPRTGLLDQNKNSVFSSALSSPVRRSLQPFHMAQGAYYSSSNASQLGNGGRRPGIPTEQDNGGLHGVGPLTNPQSGEVHGVNSLVAPPHMYGQQTIQNRESNLYCENDSTMDMHAESLAHGFYH